jgi:hypothetical protein
VTHVRSLTKWGTSGYRSRGPGFDSRRYLIFWEVVGLERTPLILVRAIEELLERKNSGSNLENRQYSLADPLGWPRNTLYPQKCCTNFADKLRSLGRYSCIWWTILINGQVRELQTYTYILQKAAVLYRAVWVTTSDQCRRRKERWAEDPERERDKNSDTNNCYVSTHFFSITSEL